MHKDFNINNIIMNSKEIGNAYESYVKSELQKEYDFVYLWKEVPVEILIEHKIARKNKDGSILKSDVGIDIVAIKKDVTVFIQCKNYESSAISIDSIAGFSFFKQNFPNLKCKLYYNGKLSERIKQFHDDEVYVNLVFDDKNYSMKREIKNYVTIKRDIKNNSLTNNIGDMCNLLVPAPSKTTNDQRESNDLNKTPNNNLNKAPENDLNKAPDNVVNTLINKGIKYNCELCAYSTNCKNSWYNHKKTNRHKKLTNLCTEINENRLIYQEKQFNNNALVKNDVPVKNVREKMKYNCELCGYSTGCKNSWFNHKKTIKHKKLVDMIALENNNNVRVVNPVCKDEINDFKTKIIKDISDFLNKRFGKETE